MSSGIVEVVVVVLHEEELFEEDLEEAMHEGGRGGGWDRALETQEQRRSKTLTETPLELLGFWAGGQGWLGSAQSGECLALAVSLPWKWNIV